MANEHGAASRGLEVCAVSVRRGARLVLDQVSLRLARGELLVVVGPNGAGKTTLLETVLGAQPLERGSITLDGQPLRTWATRAQAFAYVAAEAEPAAEEPAASIIRRAQGRLASHDKTWERQVRARLGVDTDQQRAAGALSRGERRRLLLYEALTLAKPFVLLDEPTGVFDPLQLIEVVALLQAAAAERGTGLLLSVHQMSDAEALGTRILILQRGRALALGTLDELRELAQLDSRASLQAVFLRLLRAPAPEPSHVQP